MKVTNMFRFFLFMSVFVLFSSAKTNKDRERRQNNSNIFGNIFIDGLETPLNASASCGNWQEQYSQLHANILSGVAPQRYLVALAPPQGLADRLCGLVTQFLFALLTNRAFLQVETPSTPSMKLAYNSFNMKGDIPALLNEHLATVQNLSIDGFPSTVNKSLFYGYYLNAGKMDKSQHELVVRRNYELFVTKNFKLQPPGYDSSYVVMSGNRGMSWRMFRNKYHSGTLRSMGLERENVFHCVFDYMLQLKTQACQGACFKIKEELQKERAKGTIIIGIQLRLGDHVMDKKFNASNVDFIGLAAQHISCAFQLSSKLEKLGRNTKFLFLSDSLDMRKAFVNKFPRKAIVRICYVVCMQDLL